MRARAAARAAGILFALVLAACAPIQVVRIPSPPAEVKKEAPLPPAEEPKDREQAVRGEPAAKEPAPPPPDYAKMYAEAIARTKEAIAKGKTREAVPSWKALEESPWRADAIYHQGVLHHIAGDLDEAAEQYRRVVSSPPLFEPAAANLLGIHLLRGEKENLEGLVASVFPPGSTPSRDMLPELQANLGAALLETGREDDAALLFLALRAQGESPPSLSWNMAVLAYRGGDRETARRLAGALPPEVASLYPVIASRTALFPDAEGIPAMSPPPAGHPRLAILFRNLEALSEYRRGNLAAALDLLKPPVADRSAPAELVSNLGLLQMETGSWKDARETLERAVRENPSMPEGWLNLGIFLEVYEGNTERARKCYETYVRMNGWRKKEVEAWLGWLPVSQPPSPPQ